MSARGWCRRWLGLTADAPRAVWLNTGEASPSVWLNGRLLHRQGAAWTGFHAGKERLAAELVAGRNTLVIELSGRSSPQCDRQAVWEEPPAG